MSQAIDSV